MVMTVKHSLAILCAVAGLLVADAGSARAQTADDLFNAQTLHDIRIFINTRELRLLREHFLENTYYTADLVWRNLRVRNVGVRSRGVASRSGTKPALRVDFDRYTTGQRFVGLRSLVLKNLWEDGSMMHEALAMSLIARLGQPVPREAFCRLFINNEYQGLYAIVESVDTSFLERSYGESSGYLFSFQLGEAFHGEDLGDDLAPYKALFEAQTHEREADSVLYVPIRTLFREVNQDVDAVWRERVEQYIDLVQFVTEVGMEAFLAENDGLVGMTGMNNFYLYRPADSNRHRVIPWDKDNAFLLLGYPILTRADENVIFRRAMQFDDLRDLFFQTIESAARAASEDNWLESEITRITNLISAAVEADTRKPFSTDAFFESVEFLKEFARIRPEIVRQQIADARQERDGAVTSVGK
jgi:spore coat protein CotH